jgi:hypothetical protein
MEQQHAHWIAQAALHWQEHQPRRYKALKVAGTLAQELREAADETARELESLRNQGFDQHQAWEMVRENHLFPPEEQGASPEAPNSPGYLLALEAQQGMAEIRMPGEPEL